MKPPKQLPPIPSRVWVLIHDFEGTPGQVWDNPEDVVCERDSTPYEYILAPKKPAKKMTDAKRAETLRRGREAREAVERETVLPRGRIR